MEYLIYLQGFISSMLYTLTWDEGLNDPTGVSQVVNGATWADSVDCKVSACNLERFCLPTGSFQPKLRHMHGQVGRCIALDGNQQYVSFPRQDFSILTRGFSFSFWVRHERDPNSYYWPEVFNFGNGPYSDNMFVGATGGSTGARFVILTGTWSEAYIDQAFPPYTWIHYVWVVEKTGSNSLSKIYQNGVLVSQVQNMQYPRTATSINNIGKSNWGEHTLFRGKIDSFGIYRWPLLQTNAIMLFGASESTVSPS
jgi:hypothetical protein